MTTEELRANPLRSEGVVGTVATGFVPVLTPIIVSRALVVDEVVDDFNLWEGELLRSQSVISSDSPATIGEAIARVLVV